MGTRVHNLEAELFKREKGPLGSKWARKLVVVDGAKRTIRYHKPNEDKRKTPRKIFRLANMSLVPSASGPKNAPAAFALTCSETGYALVLACELGAEQHRAWCTLLAPLCAGGSKMPPPPGAPAVSFYYRTAQRYGLPLP